MTDDRLIATLNDLIEASKDGERGFALAGKDNKEPELAAVFSDGEEVVRPRDGATTVEECERGAIAEGHYRVLDLRNRLRDRVARALHDTERSGACNLAP
jgi:hypothetical protein